MTTGATPSREPNTPTARASQMPNFARIFLACQEHDTSMAHCETPWGDTSPSAVDLSLVRQEPTPK